MDKIPVLAYHGFNDKISGSKANKYNIAIDALARQMELLFDRNYRTLSLDLLVSGEKSPSDKIKEIVITFDDGHLSNFTRVLPVLEKYSYKAIFFVTTGLIGKESDFMDWKQVSELSRKGHDVQSHGHTHRFLNQLSSEQVRRELEQSRDLIYSHTGKRPLSFSCPGGRFDSRTIEIARETGYCKMFISRPGYFKNDNNRRLFSLDRWMITTDVNMDSFKRILESDGLFLVEGRIKYFLKNGLKVLLGENKFHNLSTGIKNGKG